MFYLFILLLIQFLHLTYLVIDLFRLSAFSRVVFDIYVFLGICPVHLSYLTYWHTTLRNIHLNPFCFCKV